MTRTINQTALLMQWQARRLTGALPLLVIVQAMLSLATIYASVCIHTKRLHDMGQTGWWQVLPWVLGPALVFGALTVLAPWFVMQPAMGAGFLALKTPTPLRNSLRNLANHSVFGVGLYLAAAALAQGGA